MAKASFVPTALCAPLTGAKGKHSTNSIRSPNTQVPLSIMGRRPSIPSCPVVYASNEGLRFAQVALESNS